MNKEVLKRLIKEAILENRKKSVLLESPYLQQLFNGLESLQRKTLEVKRVMNPQMLNA